MPDTSGKCVRRRRQSQLSTHRHSAPFGTTNSSFWGGFATLAPRPHLNCICDFAFAPLSPREQVRDW
jgi:hypothetical protein